MTSFPKSGALRLLLLALFFLPCVSYAQRTNVDASAKMPAHPRILLLKGEEKALKKNIAKDEVWTEIHNAIIEEADKMLPLTPLERIKEGKRLLGVSRTYLRRVFYLSYAYRMTGDKKYALKAEQEMLKSASFSDWNPSHFLDVGEMTMALAIGYDWVYDRLSPSSREAIENAIFDKGIKQAHRSYNGRYRGTGNWNQVCNGGVSYGCLAVWEKDPELCSETVDLAIESIKLPISKYAPDGDYPEGVGYWDYGTSFNAMFCSAIEKIFKSDFGLCSMPGFMESSRFVLNLVSPALNNFSYSDNGTRAGFYPCMFWFAAKTGDQSILYNQKKVYLRDGVSCVRNDRLAPAALVWGANTPFKELKVPKDLAYKASGDSPVVAVRSSWEDENAAWLCFKGGFSGQSHAHMDVGEFVYECDGLRWAIDLGGENYYPIESKGVDLWNMTQESQRWDVYRYNNFHHNTLTFNRKRQLIKGFADIDEFSTGKGLTKVVSDLSKVYEGQVASVKRSVSFVNGRDVVVEDLVENGNSFTMMTWTLVTPATATKVSDNVMKLEQEGKTLYVKVECPTAIRWKVEPAVSEFTFNSPNPGISIVSFDTDLPLAKAQLVKVTLTHENK